MAANIDQQKKLQKKARKKYLSSALAHALVRVDPEYKPYILSCGCCGTLAIDDNRELRSLYYCKNRWCSTCASINTAILIQKYLPAFQRLNEQESLFFVTLTKPTIPSHMIPDRLVEMQKAWRKITDLARKKCVNFTGVRKTELKVSAGNENLYHPHYHVIISNRNNAEYLVSQWLKINQDANIKSQDITKINSLDNGLLELFKYSTKITAADNSGNVQLAEPWKLDIIYKSLKGKRIFQGFGGMNSYVEGFNDSELTADTVNVARGIYQWQGVDWYHTDYGHALTNWTPTAEEISLSHWKSSKKISQNLQNEL